MIRARWAIASSVADQGVAALTNIAVLVVAARLSSAADFAVFSIVYMIFTLLLGVQSSYVGQALVLERDAQADPFDPAEPESADRPRGGEVAAACRSAVVFSALAACVLGPGSAAALAFLPGEVAAGLTALGIVLPMVLVQDVLRYCFSVMRLPHLALAGDLLRLGVAVPALAAQPYGADADRLIAVWGVSALPALLLGAALLAPLLRGVRGDPRRYLRRGHLGRRFVVEFAMGNGSSQLAIVGLGLFASQLAVGALRGATTLFGPMNVLYNSATSFGPPLLRRAGGPRRQVRATAGLALLLAAVAAAWATVLILLPDRLGEEILGDTWAASSGLLPATGSQYAGIALGTCALLTLRVLCPKATLPIQVVFSLLAVGCMLTGYALGGVSGAAWGLCAGSALKATALWLRVRSVRRASEPGAGVSATASARPT